ncbi:hypothetical protein CA13_29560 [Planctomycetes bacterium CA13]|uniref:Beta-agarase n=1 Tax=Novipirellula herctigrandis TaxID=2527986 RepID=A0A5C5Z4M7_9BACT|nr:hypothetical protein CA13_29560 [Planctomycetes bacterium CA13]
MKTHSLRTILIASLLVAAALLTPQATAASGTGYVRVEQIDGVWWFISPDGQKFVSLGVNHIEPHLWLAPYNQEATLKRYGADMLTPQGRFDTDSEAAEKWINRQVEICRDLRFNTFGKHTHPSISPSLYQDKVYYLASLETAPLALWRHEAGEGPMPDIFSSDFEVYLNQRVAEVVSQHKQSRNLLGYLYTDIPHWVMPDYIQRRENERVMIYPWLNTIVRLGASSPGKQRWIEHLKSRYSTAEAAAKVWGMSAPAIYGTSWEQLAHQQTWFDPSDAEAAEQDMESFMQLIADRWYRLHHDAIRQHDRNHLIFGDKTMIEMYRKFLIPSLKKYVDVIVVQSYNRWSKDAETTDWIYQQLGKPIFNGDGSYAYVHPNQQQYKVKGWWTNAKDLADVSAMYKETLDGMMAKPYIIGWHHCGMLQQWDGALRGDVDSNENGFMDPFENYYTEWTDVIREFNSKAADLHEAAK